MRGPLPSAPLAPARARRAAATHRCTRTGIVAAAAGWFVVPCIIAACACGALPAGAPHEAIAQEAIPQEAIPQSVVPLPVRRVPPPTARVARAWPVMGTMLTVTAWGADTAVLLSGVHAARDSVRLIDSLMSTYRSTSDVSRVNARAGGPPVHVSPHVIAVLQIARRDWRLSGGAFDPTVGPLVRAWGFHGTHGRIPSPRVIDSLRALVDFSRVEIDAAASTVRLPVAGMQLDLGGVAKGYALDLARSALDDARVTGGMVDLGGNVLVFGHPPAGTRWRIGIRHPRAGPHGMDRLLGVMAIDSGAVATSGDYEHAYVIDGVRYAHLIDPRSGRPARGVMAATIVAPRGSWSDGLSAALYLVGPVRAMALADSLGGIGAIVVTDCGDDRVTRLDVWRSARVARRFTFDPALPRARPEATMLGSVATCRRWPVPPASGSATAPALPAAARRPSSRSGRPPY